MTRFPTWFLLFCLCEPCFAQQTGRKGEKSGPDARADPRALVESLASRNRPPKHVGEEHDPIFDPRFDWTEDARLWVAIDSVAKHAEEAWPELVSHLGDDRYCVTYESFSEYNDDLTVGDVCREIVIRNLASGYFESVKPDRKVPHLRLSHPDFLPESRTLKEWCEERRGKKLYELQIELCAWATAELAKPGAIPEVEAHDAREWTALIHRAAETLRRSKTAVLWDGFSHIEFVPYSRTRADAVLKRIRERDENSCSIVFGGRYS